MGDLLADATGSIVLTSAAQEVQKLQFQPHFGFCGGSLTYPGSKLPKTETGQHSPHQTEENLGSD